MFVGERVDTYYSNFCPVLIVPGRILFSKKLYSYYRSVFEKEADTVLTFKDWTQIEIYLQNQVRIFQCDQSKKQKLKLKFFFPDGFRIQFK